MGDSSCHTPDVACKEVGPNAGQTSVTRDPEETAERMEFITRIPLDKTN